MISHRAGANILLASSVVLLVCFMLFLAVVLVDDNAEMYGRIYRLTYPFQPVFAYAWVFSLALSILLLLVIPIYFGRTALRLTQWKISIGVFLVAGIPSLAIAFAGFFMQGI